MIGMLRPDGLRFARPGIHLRNLFPDNMYPFAPAVAAPAGGRMARALVVMETVEDVSCAVRALSADRTTLSEL